MHVKPLNQGFDNNKLHRDFRKNKKEEFGQIKPRNLGFFFLLENKKSKQNQSL